MEKDSREKEKMKNLSSVLVFLLTLVLAEDKAVCCTFSPYSGSEGIHVAQINSGKVYTLFTEHIGNNYPEEVLSTISRGKEDTAKRLNELLSKRREVIQSEMSDVRKITDLVKSRQISWIGIEASPGEMERSQVSIEGLVQDYLDMKGFWGEHLKNVNGWNEQKTDQILHLMYAPHIIARAKLRSESPDPFKTIPTIPLDNDEAKAKMEKMMEKRDQAIDGMTSLITSGIEQNPPPPWLMPLLSFGSGDDEHPYPWPIKHISNDELQNFLNKIKNENEDKTVVSNLTELATKYVETTNEFLKENKKRDETAAEAIYSQSGHGLVTMGSAHKQPVESRLTQLCQNPLPRENNRETIQETRQ